MFFVKDKQSIPSLIKKKVTRFTVLYQKLTWLDGFENAACFVVEKSNLLHIPYLMTPLADLSQNSVIRLFYYITLMSLEEISTQ